MARIAIDFLLLRAAIICQSVLLAHSLVSGFVIIRLLSASIQSASLLPNFAVYNLVRFALSLQMQLGILSIAVAYTEAFVEMPRAILIVCIIHSHRDMLFMALGS